MTTTTTTTTTTTAPPSQKSTSWDAAPCPDANGSLSFWLEVSIPVDANHPSHVISDPPNCADTTVETSATTGAGSYRVDFFLTGGAGATGGTDAVAMTVFWT